MCHGAEASPPDAGTWARGERQARGRERTLDLRFLPASLACPRRVRAHTQHCAEHTPRARPRPGRAGGCTQQERRPEWSLAVNSGGV